MLLPGEVTATTWLPTCDVIRQTVVLPGKCTPDRTPKQEQNAVTVTKVQAQI